MSIPSEAVIINALNHEIRREILKILQNKAMSFTSLLDFFDIAPGKLDYHLKLLGGFVEKNKDGDYVNTALGNRIYGLVVQINSSITDSDRSVIKKAFTSQVKENRSFLQIRVLGGLYFKIIALISIFITMGTLTIYYINLGVDVLALWPLYLLMGVLGGFGFVYIYKQYGPAKEFAKQVEELLETKPP